MQKELGSPETPKQYIFRIGQLKQIFTISVRKKKSSYSSAGRFLYCLTDFKPVAPYVAVSRSFFSLQPSLFMNLQTVFFPRTGSLNFFRLLRVFNTPSVRLNRSAVNAVQWRHYSLTFALIHAKRKTRFSSGKPRNTVWKCLHDTELLHFFRSWVMFNVQTINCMQHNSEPEFFFLLLVFSLFFCTSTTTSIPIKYYYNYTKYTSYYT